MVGSSYTLMDWRPPFQKLQGSSTLRTSQSCHYFACVARRGCLHFPQKVHKCIGLTRNSSTQYRISTDFRKFSEVSDLIRDSRTQNRNNTNGLSKLLKIRAQMVSGADEGLPESMGKLGAVSGASQSSGLVEFITSERVKVVAMLALALGLCNADRVVMSVAIVPLSSTYGWSTSFSGVVQSSFLWGYFMSPIAGGTLVDRYGGKRVMAWGVAVWSLATFLTPWAATHSSLMLLAMRMLLGIAEGVALPCMNNMISRWFPRTERARAVGLSMSGFHLGSVIGLITSPIIMAQTGVFGPFVIFGICGFLWLLVWVASISRSPQYHSQISKSELSYILNGNENSMNIGTEKMPESSGRLLPPFGLLLSKLPTWTIIVANAMNNWGYFIILSWMPIYFKTIYGVNLQQAAWFSAIPWAMMAALGYVAGAISDNLIQSGFTVTFVRKLMQSVGEAAWTLSFITSVYHWGHFCMEKSEK